MVGPGLMLDNIGDNGNDLFLSNPFSYDVYVNVRLCILFIVMEC